jgi:ribonucleoside-diphosphate reductase alpha chain
LNITKNWIKGIDYPEFMLDRSLTTLEGGYLIGDESPRDAIARIARRVKELIPSKVYKGNLEAAVFNHIWNGSICPSSPVWSNFGTNRGLPISCFGSYVDDSIEGIYGTLKENAKMSQLGGGTSSYWGDVRPRGSAISGQTGSTGGVYEFLKDFDGMISRVSQGGTRRGSHAVYIPFTHGDLEELRDIRKVGNDIQDLFYAVVMTDEDYESIYAEDEVALDKWARILESRNETGLPYILNSTNANKGFSTPPWYGEGEEKILASNLCSEIFLPSNTNESFVCCLLSMNALNYDTWKNDDAVEVAIIIQEAILTDFIIKTSGINDMQRARRFAERHRSIGLGVLGLATYLQSKMQPFVGIYANAINTKLFKDLRDKAEKASENLAIHLGNAPIVNEYNIKNGTSHLRRHATLLAMAPTTSNATIAGGVSPGIEPLASNYYVQKSAKGNFTIVNPYLKTLISQKYPEHDTPETIDSIRKSGGSVQHLTWMDSDEREVFLTFSEINQFEIVRLAAIRQKFIDQGQSLNVHIAPDTDPKAVSALYLMGAYLGIKSFYYQRSSNVLRDKGDNNTLTMDASACVSCEG